MNKICILLAIVALAISCEESPDPCEVPTAFDVDEAILQADIETIDQYLVDNSIEAENHSTGLRYIIHKPGTGSRPNICNDVLVGYEGRLLDGTVFDKTAENDASRFGLQGLIKGWQVGIPQIAVGGEITLFIPSPLGYAGGAPGNIPPNSILVFDITLYDVQ